MLRSMLPQYDSIVLFDNNIEKCLGFSQKEQGRLSNDPSEYIIVRPFRGDMNDNELQYGKGKGCMDLFDFIKDYQTNK